VHAKDGQSRQTSPGASNRPRTVRAIVTSIAALAGFGVFAAACGLALLSRRKRRTIADVAAIDMPLQQLTRYRAADGTHSIHGTLIAEFEPGDRSATLHIAFCPPFERLPTVELEAVDNSFATVKLTQLLHNGVQIEVRLPQSLDEKQSVTIEMLATEALDSET
jgi:hypothetical protein